MKHFFPKTSFFAAAFSLAVLAPGCREPELVRRTETRTRTVSHEVVLPREGVFHQVSSGETLYSICKKYGKSVEAIRLVNGMEVNEVLQPGQMVFIPAAEKSKGESPPPPPSPTKLEPFSGQRTSRFIRPVQGRIVTRFQQKDKGVPSDGVTFEAQPGEPVWVVRDGTVRMKTDHFPGLGRAVMIEHAGGIHTLYGRLSDIRVRPNQQVKQGDVIGMAGPTGSKQLTRVHFRVYRGTTPVDPANFY